jgi:DNA-binding MarR family transcriptional regulator
MNGEDGSQAKTHFAEDFGLFFEREGMPRMAGRILGWLLVTEAPATSLQELAEALQASKGSISTITRSLIQMGMLERVAVPGHRRDYVRIKPGGFAKLIQDRMAMISTYRHLFEHGLELVEGKAPEARARLSEVRDMYAFFESEMPLLLERFEKKRKTSHSRSA